MYYVYVCCICYKSVNRAIGISLKNHSYLFPEQSSEAIYSLADAISSSITMQNRGEIDHVCIAVYLVI